MTKLKTKRAAAKRFGFTGTGKVKRRRANHRHCLTGQPKQSKSLQRKPAYLAQGDAALVRKMLPYG